MLNDSTAVRSAFFKQNTKLGCMCYVIQYTAHFIFMVTFSYTVSITFGSNNLRKLME